MFLFAGSMVLGLFMVQRWLNGHPDVAPLHHCLLEMEKLEPASGRADDAQEQQRRALEVYVAGRFAETISDLAVLSHSSFAKNLSTENQRKIAEQAVATHPDPSTKEVTEATARLQPFLDEMPDGLPGLSGGANQMLVFVFAVAAWNLLALMAVPSAICALLFRGGLLMYVFGIAVVTKDGFRASRPRAFWRSLVTWSPCVLLPMLMVLLKMSGLANTWSLYLLPALSTALVAWSASMPERGIPDRLAGTYPVPR